VPPNETKVGQHLNISAKVATKLSYPSECGKIMNRNTECPDERYPNNKKKLYLRN
jgi:hypothetical protein